MKNIPSYILVLIFVCLGGCIAVGESRPCGLAEDGKEIRCGVGYKCVRRWCVPQDWSFPDAGGREHKAKEERQESSSTEEESSKEQAPTEKEVPKESPLEQEVDTKQCTETCHLGDAKYCYSGKSGCTAGGTCQGVCQQGQQFCHLENGCPTWSTCFDEITPVVEVCNNKDDDCDGKVDEELKRSCQSACGNGNEVCVDGKWSSCDAPAPKTEECNGQDDDCNGVPDDGDLCQTGESCQAGVCVKVSPCSPACKDTETCVEGQCVPKDPCAGVSCSATQECVDGKCVDKPQEEKVTQVEAPANEPTETEQTTGNDAGNTTPDNGNTTPDNGNTTPDNGTTTPDNGTTTPDNGVAPSGGCGCQSQSNSPFSWLALLMLLGLFFQALRIRRTS